MVGSKDWLLKLVPKAGPVPGLGLMVVLKVEFHGWVPSLIFKAEFQGLEPCMGPVVGSQGWIPWLGPKLWYQASIGFGSRACSKIGS